MTLTADDIRHHLTSWGWRVDRIGLGAAVRLFQAGYSLTGHLTVDGVIGDQTRAAVAASAAAGGRCSPHFTWAEMRCQCGGRYPSCQRIWVSRWLVDGIEAYRAAYSPDGLNVLSVCRCPQWNAAQDGKPESQHLRGQAADVPAKVSADAVAKLGRFQGIGYGRITRKVRHVDTRGGSPIRFVDGW